MTYAALPSWVDPDNARTIALVVGIGALVLAVLVMRFVQKLVLKIVLTVVLVGLGAASWYSRADLSQCATTCSCKLFGQEVTIPADKNPACQQPVKGKAAPASTVVVAGGAPTA
jgi:hypothetical protein